MLGLPDLERWAVDNQVDRLEQGVKDGCWEQSSRVVRNGATWALRHNLGFDDQTVRRMVGAFGARLRACPAAKVAVAARAACQFYHDLRDFWDGRQGQGVVWDVPRALALAELRHVADTPDMYRSVLAHMLPAERTVYLRDHLLDDVKATSTASPLARPNLATAAKLLLFVANHAKAPRSDLAVLLGQIEEWVSELQSSKRHSRRRRPAVHLLTNVCVSLNAFLQATPP